MGHVLLQPMEIYVDDETKLTLHGLQQYYIKLAETEKNRKLNDLLDLLDFNQASPGCLVGDVDDISRRVEAVSAALSTRVGQGIRSASSSDGLFDENGFYHAVCSSRSTGLDPRVRPSLFWSLLAKASVHIHSDRSLFTSPAIFFLWLL